MLIIKGNNQLNCYHCCVIIHVIAILSWAIIFHDEHRPYYHIVSSFSIVSQNRRTSRNFAIAKQILRSNCLSSHCWNIYHPCHNGVTKRIRRISRIRNREPWQRMVSSLQLVAVPDDTAMTDNNDGDLQNENMTIQSNIIPTNEKENNDSNDDDDTLEDSVRSRKNHVDQNKNRRKHSKILGLDCVHVTIELPIVGSITIVEANAKSQEILVDLALLQEEEKVDQQLSLSKGDPYGAVLWPASSAVAKYMLLKNNTNNHEPFLSNKVIIEIGAGTGLISIAAACLCRSSDSRSNYNDLPDDTTESLSIPLVRGIIATDYEYIPLELLKYAATTLNNIPAQVIQTSHFDLCDFHVNNTIHSILYQHGYEVLNDHHDNADDNAEIATSHHNITSFENDDDHIISSITTTRERVKIRPSDVLVVAADIMYEPKTGTAMARRAIEALRNGYHVIIGDSPGRAGRPAFLSELHQHFSVSTNNTSIPRFTNYIGNTVVGKRHDLICGNESTTYTRSRDDNDDDINNNDGTECTEPVVCQPIEIAILELDPLIHKHLLVEGSLLFTTSNGIGEFLSI